MNKFLVIPVILGMAIVISASLLLSEKPPESTPSSSTIYESGFTYYDIETIQETLAEKNIFVSAPNAITDHTIGQYCTYFEKGLEQTVSYCTTTSVLDSQGNSLGNINIGGDIESPVLAVANLEVDTLESNKDDVFLVFEAMIQTLVCDCWEDDSSREYESISSWLEAAHTFYNNSDRRDITSKIDNLGDYEIILEITSKDDSLLQTLIILK